MGKWSWESDAANIYHYFNDTNGWMVEISVSDELTPMLKRTLAHNKSYLRHVTKSLGWYIQGEIKRRIKKGEFDGITEGWSKKWFTNGKIQPRRELQGGHASRWMFGKMLQAIGYQYVGDSGTVRIGWTSEASAVLGANNEMGDETAVSKGVRRKYYEAYNAEVKKYGEDAVNGKPDYDKFIYPLSKKKKEIVIPRRPIFEPAMSMLREDFAPYIEKKVEEYMTENVEFGKKNRRKYKVYSFS